MPGEYEIINQLCSLLPQGRDNTAHESDCEIIRLGGEQYLFTTDEFSGEDRFIEKNGSLLGWNVAAGALSDIYACGGTPLYYAHALTIGASWDMPFIRQFGRGVAAALTASGAKSIGGDCGSADAWRCTATVIGACEGRPLTRKGARPGHGIYLTGRIGRGNMQAALSLMPFQKLPMPDLSGIKFPLRMKESALIKRYASSCIDTSDGVFRALSIIADLNGCGYAIKHLPFDRAAALLAQAAFLPRIMLFFGECGEYELLCTVPPECERRFLSKARAQRLHLHRIGTITEQGRQATEGTTTLDLSTLDLEARRFPDTRAYVRALSAWVKKPGAQK
ncbi:MAG: thiamine-monophosphate kinase [Chitinispirillaceae bacterium]|nr:thiamine-monophosphate kinase [Chitinispirillaceae bacterium]